MTTTKNTKKLYPLRIWGKPAHPDYRMSISDNDLCATCTHCTYDPGNISGCNLGWPASVRVDDGGEIRQCISYQERK